jgi:CDP-diacylglycerol--glycerol-3-phosphate 3-phosphatidyltransferase
MNLRWLPNALSAGRLAMVPVLIACVYLQSRTAFIVALTVALLSDAVDGAVARALNVSSELGAKLDSWGDAALYLTVPIGAALLWPEVVENEWPWLLALIAAFILPIALGFLKYRKLTSYHTIAAKVVAFAVPLGAAPLLLGGTPWPFRLAVVLLVISALEEVLLTLTLREWRSNVGSIVLVWKERHPGEPTLRR